MNQAELRAIEARCTQEEPPQCTAACPLHLDARKLCKLAGQGKWNEAWAVVAKTLPLPGVLSRICDEPCKDSCLRDKCGGAIELGALERVCAEQATKSPKSLPMPSKGKTIHIYGGGIAGLSAASDLLRKGFGVRLVSADPAKQLKALPESILPPGALSTEMDALLRLGLQVDVRPFDKGDIQTSLEESDGVFLDPEEADGIALGFGQPDELTLGTLEPGLFAAQDESSPILKAASGRRAALSLERSIQGVSLTAGRDREAPFVSRLFTNISAEETIAPAPVPESGYTPEQAQEEARRCIQCECLECVKNCPYLKEFGSYPKVYARQIYNNASIVMGTRQANTMINSCMLCGLCETICPEDFSMEHLCLSARRDLVENQHMPPSAHEFAIRDMNFANGDKCRLVRKAPGHDTCSRIFFPGCQLTASNPEAVEKTYAFLREQVPDTGIFLGCCGAPAQWSGRQDAFQQEVDRFAGEWEALGRPEIIAACPTCTDLLRSVHPAAGITTLWETLYKNGSPQPSSFNGDTLVVHDPCGSRNTPSLQMDVRSLMKEAGLQLQEPPLTREYTDCCGFGGLLSDANPPLAELAAKRCAEQAPGDYITYCAMCRDMLARTGKRISHALDIYFPPSGDPASRPAPGHSERRENRARLKERLLQDLWGEAPESREPHEAIRIEFAPGIKERMDERRILITDLQKVLQHVQATARSFMSTETGRELASFRPVSVTYWVEYERTGDTYVVHNAWCHRMQIMGEKA